MARTKKTTPEVEEVQAPEPTTEVAVEESEAKKAFRAFIETYKQRNPVKYELKKEALEAQLNSL